MHAPTRPARWLIVVSSQLHCILLLLLLVSCIVAGCRTGRRQGWAWSSGDVPSRNTPSACTECRATPRTRRAWRSSSSLLPINPQLQCSRGRSLVTTRTRARAPPPWPNKPRSTRSAHRRTRHRQAASRTAQARHAARPARPPRWTTITIIITTSCTTTTRGTIITTRRRTRGTISCTSTRPVPSPTARARWTATAIPEIAVTFRPSRFPPSLSPPPSQKTVWLTVSRPSFRVQDFEQHRVHLCFISLVLVN